MCGVITSVDQCALCARSTHDVHHAIVEVNIVIGVLLGELHVVVRVDPVVVCDDVVVRRTLVLIALHRSHCFRRSHFSKKFAVLEIYCLQMLPIPPQILFPRVSLKMVPVTTKRQKARRTWPYPCY